MWNSNREYSRKGIRHFEKETFYFQSLDLKKPLRQEAKRDLLNQ